MPVRRDLGFLEGGRSLTKASPIPHPISLSFNIRFHNYLNSSINLFLKRLYISSHIKDSKYPPLFDVAEPNPSSSPKALSLRCPWSALPLLLLDYSLRLKGLCSRIKQHVLVSRLHHLLTNWGLAIYFSLSLSLIICIMVIKIFTSRFL